MGVLVNRVKIQREVRFTVVELAHPHTAVRQATVHRYLDLGTVNRRFAVDKHLRRSDTCHGLRVQQLCPGIILHPNRGGVLVQGGIKAESQHGKVVRNIKGLGEGRLRGISAICRSHRFTDKPSTGGVGVFDNDLISTVQCPAVQFQRRIGVTDLIATVNSVPLAVPQMTVIRPYAAVNTNHSHAEGLNVNDIVIVCKQAAAAGVSDQLQTVHVRVNGECRRSEHLLQGRVNHPRVRTLRCQRQVCVQKHFLSHVVEVFGTELALVEGSGQTSNQTCPCKGGLIFGSFRFAVQHILVRFQPLDLARGKHITVSERNR